MSAPVAAMPPWGTREATMMGVAHPDWPFHTAETRAEYEYPTGRWWLARFGDNVPGLPWTQTPERVT